MTVQVTLSAEGEDQAEAYAKIQRMARVLKGKQVRKQGTALPVMSGNTKIGSVQIEGVLPEDPEREAEHKRNVLRMHLAGTAQPAWQQEHYNYGPTE
jgi:hypothetical protein